MSIKIKGFKTGFGCQASGFQCDKFLSASWFDQCEESKGSTEKTNPSISKSSNKVCASTNNYV